MKRIKPFWLTRLAVFGLAVSIFAACSDDDGTGPDGSLDPAEAAAAMDQMTSQFLQGSEALQAIDVFGALIPDAVNAAAPALSLFPDGTEGGVIGWAEALRANVTELGAASSVASIPPVVMGTTFVYDPETGTYVPDESLTGAPTLGVRFILYAVEPVTQDPIPETEVGYIDIVDNSANLIANIGMTVVINEATLIDASVVGTFSEVSGTANVDFSGFLSDGEEQLDFGFDLNLTETSGTVDFEASFGIYTVTLSFTGDSNLSVGGFTATFSDGDDTIAFNLSVSGSLITEGSGVTINGQTVAIISGNLEDPTVTNAQGNPLNQQELAALEQLFVGIDQAFGLFAELFGFGLVLLGLAF